MALEDRVAALEEGQELLSADLQESNEQLKLLGGEARASEAVKESLERLEARIEEALLETGKELRKDFRKELAEVPVQICQVSGLQEALTAAETERANLKAAFAAEVTWMQEALAAAKAERAKQQAAVASEVSWMQEALAAAKAETVRELASMALEVGGLSDALNSAEAERAHSAQAVASEVERLHEAWAAQEKAQAQKARLQTQAAAEVAKLRRQEHAEISKTQEEQRLRVDGLAERLETLMAVVRNELGRASTASLAHEVVELSGRLEKEILEVKHLVSDQVAQSTEKQLEVMGKHLSCLSDTVRLSEAAVGAQVAQLRLELPEEPQLQQMQQQLQQMQQQMQQMQQQMQMQRLEDEAQAVAETSQLQEQMLRWMEVEARALERNLQQSLTEKWPLQQIQEQVAKLSHQTSGMADLTLQVPSLCEEITRLKAMPWERTLEEINEIASLKQLVPSLQHQLSDLTEEVTYLRRKDLATLQAQVPELSQQAHDLREGQRGVEEAVASLAQRMATKMEGEPAQLALRLQETEESLRSIWGKLGEFSAAGVADANRVLEPALNKLEARTHLAEQALEGISSKLDTLTQSEQAPLQRAPADVLEGAVEARIQRAEQALESMSRKLEALTQQAPSQNVPDVVAGAAEASSSASEPSFNKLEARIQSAEQALEGISSKLDTLTQSEQAPLQRAPADVLEGAVEARIQRAEQALESMSRKLEALTQQSPLQNAPDVVEGAAEASSSASEPEFNKLEARIQSAEQALEGISSKLDTLTQSEQAPLQRAPADVLEGAAEARIQRAEQALESMSRKLEALTQQAPSQNAPDVVEGAAEASSSASEPVLKKLEARIQSAEQAVDSVSKKMHRDDEARDASKEALRMCEMRIQQAEASLEIIGKERVPSLTAFSECPADVNMRIQQIERRVSDETCKISSLSQQVERVRSTASISEEQLSVLCIQAKAMLESVRASSLEVDAELQRLAALVASEQRRCGEAPQELERLRSQGEALEQLALGTLKLAQLLGITTEESCERLGWRDACADLSRMVDHTWLRCRLPKQVPVLKLLRQKADVETVRELQTAVEELQNTKVAGSSAQENLHLMNQLLQQVRPEKDSEFLSQYAPPTKRPTCNGRSYVHSAFLPR